MYFIFRGMSCQVCLCVVYVIILFFPYMQHYFVLGHGHFRPIWPSDHVLNIMCFLSVIVCLILFVLILCVWYWNKVWYDMIWYDMNCDWNKGTLKRHSSVSGVFKNSSGASHTVLSRFFDFFWENWCIVIFYWTLPIHQIAHFHFPN